MILVFPRRLFASQKLKELPSLDLGLCGLNEKGASPTGTYQGVDLPNQCLRKDYVCALRSH